MSTPGEMLGAIGRRLGSGRSAGDARVFRGRSVEELIPRIQRELGPDAIILRRREGLTGGMMGFFQHQWVEIEAVAGGPRLDVYDEQESATPPIPPAAAEPAPQAQLAPLPDAYAAPQPPAMAPPALPPAALQAPTAPAPAPLQAPTAPPPVVFQPPPAPPSPPVAPPMSDPARLFARESPAEHVGGSAYVTAHLASLARENRARLIERPLVPEPAAEPPLAPRTAPTVDFHELMPEPPRRMEPPPEPEPQRHDQWRAPAERRTVGPGSQGRARAGVEKGLRRYGVSERMIGELIDAANAHVLPFAPRSGLAAAVRSALAQRIPVAAALPLEGATIVIVGAGGAGKTTCCVALLGAYRQSSTLAAAFATLTREPLHGELQMLLTPQLVKPTPVENPRAQRALRRARSGGLVVLDTPPLSPADRTGIRRLGRLLGELEPERVIVALPATLGGAAAGQLLESLAPLKPNALIVTHAEETDQIGVAVEAACRFGLAPEYLLDRGRPNGWRLTRLDPAELAAMVLP
jgi:hypothetical protein